MTDFPEFEGVKLRPVIEVTLVAHAVDDGDGRGLEANETTVSEVVYCESRAVAEETAKLTKAYVDEKWKANGADFKVKIKPDPVLIDPFAETMDKPCTCSLHADEILTKFFKERGAEFIHSGVVVYQAAWGDHMSDFWYAMRPNVDAKDDCGAGDTFELDALYSPDVLERLGLPVDADLEDAVKAAIDKGWLDEDGLEVPNEVFDSLNQAPSV